MDAVKKLNEGFLSCSICTNRFKKPCTLGCGHTFCQACLSKYTKTRHDAIKAKSILCPNCRQMTKVPNPRHAVEEWPKQFKPHFLIQGLLDEFSTSVGRIKETAVPTGRLCFSCQQIGKTVEAECLCQDCDVTLCEDCVKRHTTLPGTKHHTIADLKGGVKVKGKRVVVCKEHGSAVEFCCRDCSKGICHKCIIHHRKCDSVVPIESMVDEMRQAVKENKRSITITMEELQTSLSVQQSALDTVKQNKASVQNEIKRVSQQAMNLIKRKEKQLMDELDELAEKQNGQLRGQMKSGEIDLQMYQQYFEFMDQSLKSESSMDLYDVYQMCLSGALRCATGRQTNVSTITTLSHITLEDRLQPLQFGTSFELGRLKTQQSYPDFAVKPVLYDTINIRIDGDKMDPCPVDITVLAVEREDNVVVTDCNNGNLKSFVTKLHHTRGSALNPHHKPYNVIHLKENLLAVANSESLITIVTVTPDLAVISRIETQKSYRCLTALKSNMLIVGCNDPPCIDIIDLSGKVYRSLTPDNTGQNMMKDPWFLSSTNRGQILVSDAGSKSVYCLTQEGGVVFTYHPEGDKALSGPRGITTTPSGDILVVDLGNSKVIQLTERGEFVRDLLTSQDGLKSPHGICLHGDRLYITEFIQGKVKCFTSSDRICTKLL